MNKVTSWGRAHGESVNRYINVTGEANLDYGATIFGNGRSYGDLCLNKNEGVLNTARLNNFIDFDKNKGQITCGPGVTLGEIQAVAFKAGWCLPVTPGTQFATLGGAIANDVHGKNHHRKGCFGCHVLALGLLRSSGEQYVLEPRSNSELFRATIGGLGLTGLITWASLQLMPVKSTKLVTQTTPFHNLHQFFELSNENKSWEYTVAWLDITRPPAKTRGLFSKAVHMDSGPTTEPSRNRLRAPLTPPISLVRPLSISLFNEAYFRIGSHKRDRMVVPYDNFFYPLDAIEGWNKMYGPKGFYQYQYVVPKINAVSATLEILSRLYKKKAGSFLSVLKNFGDITSPGYMSFPIAGPSLAVDVPNFGTKTLRLLDDLDIIVSEAGGRVYAAKDGRMKPELFTKGYPDLEKLLVHRDPAMTSDFARRALGL